MTEISSRDPAPLALLKRAVYGTLRAAPVNAGLRAALRPLRGRLPAGLARHLPVTSPVRVGLPSGAGFVLGPCARDWIAAQLYWRGLDGFEPETSALFLALLESCEVVLDVGASTGFYSLLAGSRGRRAHAFEPAPEAFASLRRNVERNGFATVHAHPWAVGEAEGMVSFGVPRTPWLPVSSSAVPGFRPGCATLSVRAVTLDGFVAREQPGRVDLLKIDAEGVEPQVLRGGGRLLDEHRPLVVCEVLHGLCEDALEQVLGPRGYGYFLITSGGLEERARIVGDPAYRHLNYLFAPAERRDWVRRLPVGVPPA